MTMDDVAKDVGISKATLYQHCKSKEELAVNVVLSTLMQAEDYIHALDAGLSAVVRLQKIIKWLIVKRYGELTFDFSDAEATIRPLLKRHSQFVSHEKALHDALEALVDAAKADGYIAPQLSTPVLVQAFMSCIRDGSYYDLLREGKCTLQDVETTLIGMISGFSRSFLDPTQSSAREAA